MSAFQALNKSGTIQLRIMPNPGMEGTAEYVYNHITSWLAKNTGKRVWVTKVEVRENEKNSAQYIPATGDNQPWTE
jgi:6-pyruvoyltetrahydropterin/6-carboxytetrahydropterin synthase